MGNQNLSAKAGTWEEDDFVVTGWGCDKLWLRTNVTVCRINGNHWPDNSGGLLRVETTSKTFSFTIGDGEWRQVPANSTQLFTVPMNWDGRIRAQYWVEKKEDKVNHCGNCGRNVYESLINGHCSICRELEKELDKMRKEVEKQRQQIEEKKKESTKLDALEKEERKKVHEQAANEHRRYLEEKEINEEKEKRDEKRRQEEERNRARQRAAEEHERRRYTVEDEFKPKPCRCGRDYTLWHPFSCQRCPKEYTFFQHPEMCGICIVDFHNKECPLLRNR